MKSTALRIVVAAASFAAASAFCRAPCATVEEYDFSLRLNIPRIYDNTQSLGRRKYQVQAIRGALLVVHGDAGSEPRVEVAGLVNRTYRIGGECVAYDATADGVLWHIVGDNKTGRFRTASVVFTIGADPSYNIGANEPDNTLILTLSGKGSHKSMGGYASGQIGCGCRVYGHKSPTRIMGAGGAPCAVTDIASVWGSWRARLRRTYSRKSEAAASSDDTTGQASEAEEAAYDDENGVCP